jgi:hypothetical protein
MLDRRRSHPASSITSAIANVCAPEHFGCHVTAMTMRAKIFRPARAISIRPSRLLPKADIQQPNFAMTLAALPLIDNQGSIRGSPRRHRACAILRGETARGSLRGPRVPRKPMVENVDLAGRSGRRLAKLRSHRVFEATPKGATTSSTATARAAADYSERGRANRQSCCKGAG